MQVVINKLSIAHPEICISQNSYRDPKRNGHTKIPKKFTNVLKRSNFGVSVGFFF